MKKKIFKYMCFLISTSVICTFIITLVLCYPLIFANTKEEVRDEAMYLSYVFNDTSMSASDFLKSAKTHTRITWIDKEGAVLFDNDINEQSMENHLQRKEVQDAINKGSGEAYRISTTLGTNTYYYAIKLEDGSVLRLARTNVSAYDMLRNVWPVLLTMILMIYSVSFLLASKMSKNIIEPINAIDLEYPSTDKLYKELEPMLLRLKLQNKQIRQQIKDLKNKQREFMVVISNIEEGLILINDKYKILSVNNSALDILGICEVNCIDKDLFSFTDNELLHKAVQNAISGERQEFYLSKEEKTYQIIVSPVLKHNVVKGALILFVDITAKRMAEKMRQEFSANVSHELKTPLTSISGFAELLQNNMVLPKDIPLFAGKIYKEAQRLIVLVQDIIKLSQLDEKSGNLNSNFMKEYIDLAKICKQTILRLNDRAIIKDVKLHFVQNGSADIFAVKQLIEEVVYNLIENGIKYNKAGGRVDISLNREKNHLKLTVKDSGIGISKEDLPHIFERFYRADKSRSQIKVEGTGLGLAIVKHVAEYHQAKLYVDSKVDEGTQISLDFVIAEKLD